MNSTNRIRKREHIHNVKSPPFVMTPGQSNGSVFLDYTLGTEIKIFNSVTEKLPEMFDGNSRGINLLNDNLMYIYRKEVRMEGVQHIDDK